jgi:hypothetical protein
MLRTPISPEIAQSLIYQDALLYKTAKKHNVKVIGLEGKGLEQDKRSISYDRNREEYMANVIKEVTGKGYKFIANMGAAHAKNIEEILESDISPNRENLSKIPKKLEANLDQIKNSIKQGVTDSKTEIKPISFADMIKNKLEVNSGRNK